MSKQREGLGYSLRNYDPCFNFNSDRFCCSKYGAEFRQNILASQGPLTKSHDYNAPRNYDPNDQRPLWLQQTGIVDPDPYTFTPQDRWNMWCSRLPCTVNPMGVPCRATPDYGTVNGKPRHRN